MDDWANKSGRRLVVGLLLSLLIHVGIAVWLGTREPPPKPDREKPTVTFKLKDKNDKKGAAAKAGAKPGESKIKGQVVDIPQPAVERIPEEARFLSKWNTAVEHEQKARNRGARKRNAEEAPPQPPVPPQPPRKAGAEVARDNPDGREALKPAGTDKPGGGVRLPAGTKGGPAGPANDATLHGLGGLDKLLLPTIDGSGRVAGRNVRGLTGGDVSDDAMVGVQDEGEGTLVNSRSFKYWDFFQRVKERVRSEWSPAEVFRSRDPYGKVYGTKDRLTVLGIQLDADGKVVRLEVIRESGLPFLDEEAKRAFREAGPFVNAPHGLADDKGRIAFNFGFLLELSSSRTRMFWDKPE